MLKYLKSFAPQILGVFIAIMSFLTGATTDIGQLVQIAITPDKALAQAAVLINDSEKSDIVAAVEEKAEPQDVKETIQNIKPLEPIQ